MYCVWVSIFPHMIVVDIQNTLAWECAVICEQYMCTKIRVHSRLLEKPRGKIDTCLLIRWFQTLSSLRMIRMHSFISQNSPHRTTRNIHGFEQFPRAKFKYDPKSHPWWMVFLHTWNARYPPCNLQRNLFRAVVDVVVEMSSHQGSVWLENTLGIIFQLP